MEGDFSGLNKEKCDRSKSGCESVGDNFETQYKPITNPKMTSSDCASDEPLWSTKNMGTLVNSYYKILLEGNDISPTATLRRLKRRFTQSFTHKRLGARLAYMRTIFATREDELCKKTFQNFKNKYENFDFWETYLQMVQHPNFHTFDTGTSRCKSGTSRDRSKSSMDLSAGPSSVNLDIEPDQYSIENVMNIMNNIGLDDDDLVVKAAIGFQNNELRKTFVLFENDNQRRLFLYSYFIG